jgi:hypothetical protein
MFTLPSAVRHIADAAKSIFPSVIGLLGSIISIALWITNVTYSANFLFAFTGNRAWSYLLGFGISSVFEMLIIWQLHDKTERDELTKLQLYGYWGFIILCYSLDFFTTGMETYTMAAVNAKLFPAMNAQIILLARIGFTVMITAMCVFSELLVYISLTYFVAHASYWVMPLFEFINGKRKRFAPSNTPFNRPTK